MREKLKAKKEIFENEFVQLNCKIQIIRSDNETIFEEIKDRLKEITKITIHHENKERDLKNLAKNLNNRRKTCL